MIVSAAGPGASPLSMVRKSAAVEPSCVGAIGSFPLRMRSKRGDQRRQLGRDPDGLAVVGVGVHDVGLVVVGGEHRERRPHGRHRVGVLGRVVTEVVQEVGVDRPGLAELAVELVELGLGRELALPEQVGHLLERGVLGQVADVVAAVDELALLAVDGRELGVEGGHAFEAAGLGGGRGRRSGTSVGVEGLSAGGGPGTSIRRRGSPWAHAGAGFARSFLRIRGGGAPAGPPVAHGGTGPPAASGLRERARAACPPHGR